MLSASTNVVTMKIITLLALSLVALATVALLFPLNENSAPLQGRMRFVEQVNPFDYPQPQAAPTDATHVSQTYTRHGEFEAYLKQVASKVNDGLKVATTSSRTWPVAPQSDRCRFVEQTQ